jgi:hypothetical protein
VTGERPAFAARSVDLSGGFAIEAPLEAAFELFSPLGERRWVPDWNPELLHPPGVAWERGLVFRTQGDLGEAVWVVTGLDRDRHEVEYHRIEPGRYVARVRVQCRGRGPRQTAVAVAYTFVGLSDAGNREIEAMSPRAYQEKMKSWQSWIGGHLSGRSAQESRAGKGRSPRQERERS